MALLWNKKNDRKNKRNKYCKNNRQIINKSGNPSPTNIKHIKEFAQNLLSTIKGSSLLGLLKMKLKAGMTVEAAVALPVFLLFFLNLASLMEMMRLHGNLQFALWGAGNEAALYGCIMGDEPTGTFLSSLYIRGRIIDGLGMEYLENSPLENGTAGLKVLSNPFESSKDILEIKVCYQVAPVSALIGFPSFEMSNYYYAHLWNGYEIQQASTGGEVVYVTENGVVYHRDRNCTHLRLSVEKVKSGSAQKLRNQWGRPYDSCVKCARGAMPEEVYITREGECYHYHLKCSGLKRTVRAMRLEEAQCHYCCCSRCG